MRLVERTMENLNRYIEDKGYKKVWLAKRLNMTRQNLDKILKCEKKVTIDDIEELCNVLNIKVEDVMKEDFQFFSYPDKKEDDDLLGKIAMCGELSSETSKDSLAIIEELMGFIKMMKKLSQ